MKENLLLLKYVLETLKNNTFKYMTSLLKNVNIDKLVGIVDK